MISTLKTTLKTGTSAIKIFIAALVLTTAATPIVPALAQGSVGLKQNILVDDATVKLGDIFHGLDAKHDRVLGAAPPPGKEMTLNARTLLRVALAMDVDWRPDSAYDSVTIQRTSTKIDQEDIKSGIENALIEQGIDDRYKITFDAPAHITLPANNEARFEIKTLNPSTDKERFEAIIVAPSLENPIQTIRVSGALQRMTQIPVLKDTIRTGTIISAQDIDMIDMPETDISDDVVMDESALIGMTAKRAINAERPVRLNDLQMPELVTRGDMVTIIYNHGLMTLTTQGKAMENGTKGDVIRVTNASSKKTIQAQVIADNQVSVQTF